MKNKIFTLTLSPALDKSTAVERVIPESKLRCENPKFEPGGGGINVSRGIHKLGGSSVAIYPYGGHTGELFKQLLTKEGIEQLTIPAQNWVRENFIVVETTTNRQFRFGMPGPELFPNECQQILDILSSNEHEFDYLVISGSTPKGVPDDFYAQVSSIVKQKKAKLILDTSGTALKEAFNKSGVYLCKPNINELSEIVGEQLNTIPQQEKAAMSIIEKGQVEVLVVSLGAFGAFMASKEGVYHVPAPSVNKKSTVGAGDSMVAGITWSLSQGKSLFQSLKYGVACGTAATMNSGTELFKKPDVDSLYTWIDEHAKQ
ncbi:MAG: 1-phosphofructokinase family hexose kinase [Cytophagaceae bacterium]|jgi:6-phosphofructokinase 2|nr:1-phosphofructokinase family hexose kinase [Cytophagaceae bacterium]